MGWSGGESGSETGRKDRARPGFGVRFCGARKKKMYFLIQVLGKFFLRTTMVPLIVEGPGSTGPAGEGPW